MTAHEDLDWLADRDADADVIALMRYRRERMEAGDGNVMFAEDDLDEALAHLTWLQANGTLDEIAEIIRTTRQTQAKALSDSNGLEGEP